MTDNEIIKALECCKNDDCDNCPNDFGNCYANLAGYALDLFHNYEAEIERLTYELECLLCHATGNKLSEHTYPLGTMENCVDEYIDECCEEAKAEAIKEFAERLKAKSVSLYKNGEEIVSAIPITKEDVDNLVKEMVGEGK